MKVTNGCPGGKPAHLLCPAKCCIPLGHSTNVKGFDRSAIHSNAVLACGADEERTCIGTISASSAGRPTLLHMENVLHCLANNAIEVGVDALQRLFDNVNQDGVNPWGVTRGDSLNDQKP